MLALHRVWPRRWFRDTTPRAFVALIFCLTGCNRESRDASQDAPAAAPVKVVRVERTAFAHSQAVAGTVRPFDRAVIAARVMGTVTGANFAIGQKVPAGEVLLTIQADELNARLEQARAAFDLATRDAKREAALFAQGASPEETVRSAEDRLRMARAAFNEATTLVGYTRVTAPFAGFVTRKLINTGDFAEAGTPLLEIEARDRMRAEVEVPDALPSLAIGTAVRVIASGATIVGHVTEASSAAQAPTRTRSVVVELPPGTSVHSGEFVRAMWPAGESALLFVPTDAVQLFGQIERVFVVTGSRATMRFVKTGLRENDRVQILSGLDSGEMVVVSPPATLRDGHPVRVLP